MTRFGLAVAALVVAVDQLVKWVIVEHVMVPPRVIPVTGFFNIVLVRNRGVSFGLFDSDAVWLPTVLSLLAVGIVAFLFLWLRETRDRLAALGIGLVIGGAIANVVDRVRFGAVTDFLDFYVGAWHWPAFNLADAAITTGVVLILVDGLFARRDRPM